MLRLKDIRKTYLVDKNRFPALKNINLSFASKGFVSILGPSGCGKTTLLNLIGGLDQYDSGDLIINNKSTKKFTDRDWDAYRNKRVGFVFQTYNLVPHLTVLGNVELSMTLTGMSKSARQKKAATALKRVGLKDVLKKKPNQLSGGQMQRVAIARSLVNNPEIILADEPTGALDSVTSVQVMEILKEVSKDRLVIMVTHNDELAKKYSTRIIRLKDGEVISDSKPERSAKGKEKEELVKETNKHTHMSFFTALASSARSLLTKKGRTAMTTVAASFGIIGVALVLAMSNGFQGYVARVEAETASTVPITISPYVTTAIKEIEVPEPYPSEHVIKPYDQDISQLMVIHRNRITDEYAKYCHKLLEEPQKHASSVLENHEYLDFNVFTERETPIGEKEVIKIDQFESAGAGGSILSGTTGLPSTIFHELYGGEDYIDSLYDVIYGKLPNEQLVKNSDGTYTGEVCLVCDRYNRIPTETLFELGLISSESVEEGKTYSFEELCDNQKYKIYKPGTVYTQITKSPLHFKVLTTGYWEVDLEGDGTNPGSIYSLRTPKEDKVIEAYSDVTVDKQAMRNLYDDVNPDITLKIVGVIRPARTSLVNLMPGSICYPTDLRTQYLNILSSDDIAIDIAKKAKQNWYIPRLPSMDPKHIGELMSKEEAEEFWKLFVVANTATAATGNTNNLDSMLDSGLYLLGYDTLTPFTVQKDFEEAGPETFSFKKFLRSNYRFANEFKQPIFSEYTITEEGYKVPIDVDVNTIDSFVDLTTFVKGYSTITSILLFPKSISDKHQMFKYLEKWNSGKEEVDQILYADIAGTLTDALGTLIDVISIVLIVFSSVSLLVSCVMTGVITYTSVLERTKEIGILRAIGARKKDVGRLFEAESVIVGGIAGLIGVLFTFIVEWPISLIINNRFPEQHIGMICNLSPWHAIILILISILLTFVSGFIPARKASKKDPVVALRTE